MKRTTLSLLVLAVAMTASLFAAGSEEKSQPKLTVIYYYLPG